MIATSPDGQWAAVKRGREVILLAGGAGPAAARIELPTEDADLVIVGPPTVLATVTRGSAAGGEPGHRIVLYQPPYPDPVARHELDAPMRIAGLTGSRLVLVSLDGKAVTIVRIAGRALATQAIEPGSPVEFAVGLERNQVLFSLLRKLETWDAVSGRPLLRMQLPLLPPPRTVGPAHGFLWVTRPGGDEILVCRLSDGRPFRHVLGVPIDDVIYHPASPLLILVTARGLVRLHCYAHSLTLIDAPWQPGMALGQLVVGEDISLLGMAEHDAEPWRVPIGGAGAPAITLEAQEAAGEPVVTAADKLRAMRERSVQEALHPGDRTDRAERPERAERPVSAERPPDSAERTERGPRLQRAGGLRISLADRSDPPSRFDLPDRSDRADRSDPVDRTDPLGRADPPGRADRGDLPGRADRMDRSDLSDRSAPFHRDAERSERSDAVDPAPGDRADPPGRGNQMDRSDLPGRADRGDLPGRADRMDRSDLRDRSAFHRGAERSERSDAIDPAPPDRGDLPGRADPLGRSARGAPPDRGDRGDPPGRTDPPGRGDRMDRSDLPGRGDRGDLPGRADRMDRSDLRDRSAPFHRGAERSERSDAIDPALPGRDDRGEAAPARLPALAAMAMRRTAPRGRTWRDRLAAFGAELVRGADAEGSEAGASAEAGELGELGELAQRLALPAGARRALVALYGLYLVGEPAVPLARLADALGDWTEPLGQGELGALAMLRRRGGRVALRGSVTDLLDGAGPRAIRVVGTAAAVPRPGAVRLVRDGRSNAAIEIDLAQKLGRIAVIEGGAALALLEARLHGATAVALVPPPTRPLPWPRDAGLVVVAEPAAPAWVAALPELTAA